MIDLDDGYDNSEEKSDKKDSVKQNDDGSDDGISEISFSTLMFIWILLKVEKFDR